MFYLVWYIVFIIIIIILFWEKVRQSKEKEGEKVLRLATETNHSFFCLPWRAFLTFQLIIFVLDLYILFYFLLYSRIVFCSHIHRHGEVRKRHCCFANKMNLMIPSSLEGKNTQKKESNSLIVFFFILNLLRKLR